MSNIKTKALEYLEAGLSVIPTTADKSPAINTWEELKEKTLTIPELEALFNNAYGIPAGKLGSELLTESLEQLQNLYPHVEQIENEKVLKVEGDYPNFNVMTNKSSYHTKNIVIGIGSANTFAIEGLMHFVEPHKKAIAEKQRIQLKNDDHRVTEGIYVAGTLAGHRSQLAIAAGSGAAVATDILTLWNDGISSQAHDSIRN
jgi:thioredoxin reductase